MKRTKRKLHAPEAKRPVMVTNNTFSQQTHVHFDEEAMDAVDAVAQALLVNAEALKVLASAFSAPGVVVGPMIKIVDEQVEVKK